jgi:hypothetical protein
MPSHTIPAGNLPVVHVSGVRYFYSDSTGFDMPRSDSAEVTHDDFLGLKLPSGLKGEVRQSADQNDRSISEEARQRLQAGNGDGDA